VKPRTDETRHSFREWAQVLDWIVQNLFQAPPLLDGHDDVANRVSEPSLAWLRRICLAVLDCGRCGLQLTASELAALAIEKDDLPPGSGCSTSAEDAARRIGGIMARRFEKDEMLEVDRFQIRRGTKYSERAQKSVPTYSFASSRAADFI
jgi:hypothetical protein